MAGSDDPKSYDELLAEVERSLNPGQPPAKPAARTPARRPGSTPATDASGGGDVMPAGARMLVFGIAAAALVFVLFLFLPFLGALSGAVGAFLGAAATALVLRRR